MPARLFTVDEAADYLRIGRSTLYGLLREKAIGSVRVGKRRLIAEDDLARFLEANALPPDDDGHPNIGRDQFPAATEKDYLT